MIKELRDYFAQQIALVDSDIRPWERDVFGNNDVNKGQAQRFYNLIVGSSSAVRTGNGLYDEFSVTLVLYTTSKRGILNSFDDLYDKSILIRNNIICNIAVYENHPRFVDIEPVSITPVEEESNDNTFKVELLFTVRQGFEFLIGE